MTGKGMRLGLLSAVAALGLAAARPAEAVIVITINQVGSNVVLNGGGSFNPSNLIFGVAGSASAGQSVINPGLGAVAMNGSGTPVLYDNGAGGESLSGPDSFGAVGSFFPDSSSGDFFGLVAPLGALTLPDGYNGDPLAFQMTFENTTLGALGLTPGDEYFWWWSYGTESIPRIANAVRMTIGEVPTQGTPVPAPGALAVFGVGLAGLALARRRRG